MGLIVAALVPLSVNSLSAMWHAADNFSNKSDVTSIVQYMGSLMSSVSDADHSIPIRPLHTSFREFLADSSRSEAFYVNISEHQQNLAFASLRVMRDSLSFYICQLESSYVCNRDIPNLPTLIKHYISPHLSYSCRFWADHLRTTAFDLTLLGEVKDFLHFFLLFPCSQLLTVQVSLFQFPVVWPGFYSCLLVLWFSGSVDHLLCACS
jgi:hypothetical protein